MKVLRSSFLLGAAASLAVATGASAADLPLKAKARGVEYVKICSLYGAGYYYIPGTDTCLKIGGFVRIDAFVGPSAAPFESLNFNNDWRSQAQAAGNDRFDTRARAYVTLDARTQTAYGTLRSYFLTGATIDDNAAAGAYMIRAFIQLAGFTWGLADSIFDTYAATPDHLNYVAATNGNIGATGIWQWRYTAEFGGGLYAAIAAEDPRRREQAAFAAEAPIRADWPAVLASIGAKGAWGKAAVTVAVHDASAAFTPLGGPAFGASKDAVGWAASAGALVKIPGLPGDNFGFQFAYGHGATQYVTDNVNTGAPIAGGFITTKSNGSSVGFITDGVYNPVTGAYDLTTAYGFEAGYEHAWTPNLKTAVAGGWVKVDYSQNASNFLCVINGGTAGGNCNADTSIWNVGESTKWFPVPNLQIGLDVMYTHIDTATLGVLPAAGAAGRGVPLANANIWTGLVRVQRTFWP